MSYQAINKVLEKSKTKSNKRVMMLVIAHHVNKETEFAYPSIATIARESNLDRSSVHRLLSDLVRENELDIQRRKGPNGTNLYKILLDESLFEEEAPEVLEEWTHEEICEMLDLLEEQEEQRKAGNL